MSAPLVIRALVPGDLDAVAELEEAVSTEPWSRRLFAGELDLLPSDRHWLVAVHAEAVVGFAGMMFVGDEGHLMNMAVARSHQRRGFGRRLLAELLVEARDRGVRSLTLEVRPTNESARNLYQRFGFAPVGVRPGYYDDGGDALIMWVHDVDSDRYRALLDDVLDGGVRS